MNTTRPEHIKLWLQRRILKLEKAGVKLAGYFNGSCPVCDVHIGTDVYKDQLTDQFLCFCGACGREIYQHIDQAGILWLKPFKPARAQ